MSEWEQVGKGIAHTTSSVAPNVVVDEDAIIDAYAEIGYGSLLGKRSVLCRGARVDSYVIMDGYCVIGPDARVRERTTLCADVQIGPRAQIGTGVTLMKGSVIRAGAKVGPGARVWENVVVGDGVEIPANAEVTRDTLSTDQDFASRLLWSVWCEMGLPATLESTHATLEEALAEIETLRCVQARRRGLNAGMTFREWYGIRVMREGLWVRYDPDEPASPAEKGDDA